ncbi:MAG: site-2 protease family protein [Pirellulaceae bacterium]
MKWKLGDLAGIGVYIHWSFWILPAWLLLSSLGAGGGLASGLSMVALVFAVFGCVVLHELGHALMARKYGVGTHDITLYPIGGVARLERMPTRPSQELAIALAGPAVNVVIAGALFVGFLFGGMRFQVSPLNLVAGSFLVNLLWINVALVVFNLLPAFPMDGGRVLRAFMAMRMPYDSATTIAARVGQGVAIVLGMVGFVTGSTLLLVALFVFLAARAELSMVRMRRAGWQAPTVSGAESAVWRPVANPHGHGDAEIVWVSEVRSTSLDGGTRQVVVFYPPPTR